MGAIHQKMPLNENLCEFLGALIGDGFIGNYGDRNQQYIIQMTGDKRLDAEYFNYLTQIIKENLNPKHISLRKPKGNTLRLTIYSKDIYKFFRNRFDFPSGRKDAITIPNEILNNEKYLRKTIRGIFDTDGCVFWDKRKRYKNPYPRITLETKSKALNNQLAAYLSGYFKIRNAKRKRVLGTTYLIEIYGQLQFKKWLELIGFSNKRHLKYMPL